MDGCMNWVWAVQTSTFTCMEGEWEIYSQWEIWLQSHPSWECSAVYFSFLQDKHWEILHLFCPGCNSSAWTKLFKAKKFCSISFSFWDYFFALTSSSSHMVLTAAPNMLNLDAKFHLETVLISSEASKLILKQVSLHKVCRAARCRLECERRAVM